MSGGMDFSGPIKLTTDQVEKVDDHLRKARFWLLIAGLGILIALVSLISFLWASSKSTYKAGTEYKFEYTHKFRDVDTNLPGRIFEEIDKREHFRSLEEGPRGEKFVKVDSSLPINTFKIFEKESPELRSDGRVIQERYKYREVHYNLGKPEPQESIPPFEVSK